MPKTIYTYTNNSICESICKYINGVNEITCNFRLTYEEEKHVYSIIEEENRKRDILNAILKGRNDEIIIKIQIASQDEILFVLQSKKHLSEDIANKLNEQLNHIKNNDKNEEIRYYNTEEDMKIEYDIIETELNHVYTEKELILD